MNFLLLIVFVVLFELAYTKRVSELKCEEYSRIAKTPDRKYPHLVYLTIGLSSGTIYGDLGTLLSRRFVATSSYATTLIPSKTKVYFSPSDEYNVVQKYIHPTINYTGTYSVAFLKLERPVPLDSFHRPACLWNHEYFYESFATTLKWADNSFSPDNGDWTSRKIESTELVILRDSDCTALNYLLNPTFICLQPRSLEKAEYWPTSGTPIQTEITSDRLPNNFYLLGEYLFYYPTTVHHIVGTKMNAHLDWLDKLLWEDEFSTCGSRFVQATPLITGGLPAIRGEFPWHAAISRKESSGVRKYICGGTLLNHNTVITAAHCVFTEQGQIAPELLVVALGKYDLDETNRESRETGVYRVIPNEYYDMVNFESDIALLRLRTIIEYSEFIQPICLTKNISIFDTVVGVTAGWGKNEYQQQVSILSKASLPIHEPRECRNSNRDVFEKILNENNFCAGYANGTSVCSGDSGSGLFFQSDNHFYIRGIVSLGVPLPDQVTRCDTTQFVVFTDVTKFYDWIMEKIN